MDVKELEKLVEQQKSEIEKLSTANSDYSNEIERMRAHQQTLLDETKAAKESRNKLQSQFENLNKKLEDFETKGLLHEGNYQEVLDKQVEKLKVNYEAKIDELSNSLSEATGKYESIAQKYNSEKINGVLRKAAESANVIPTAIDDVIFRANGLFSIGDDGSIESRDGDGNLRKVGKKQLTPETFVESLKESAPHLWPSSDGVGANGGGKKYDGKVNPWMKDTFNRTEQAKIANENPELASTMAEEAGVKLS